MRSKKKLQSGSRSPATDASERIAAIIEGAEQAAAGVIDDAEKQARRHLEDAQAQADRLAAERLRALADELDPPAPTAGERPQPFLKSVEELPPEPGVAAVPEPNAPPRRAASAGARLLATQMAVSGSSREEIESRLRSGFEIEDTSEILDAILGPEE
jgi:hypothetical protein